MATLKQHQATMVSMLASGTAIPTSAIRLAHALHDVLAHINDTNAAPVAHTERRIDATTPGLNDALLAADVQAVKPKQQSLESLLKQRDNTIRQLRESNLKLRGELEQARKLFENGFTRSIQAPLRPEQAGCRKEDTQLSDDGWIEWAGSHSDDWPVNGETFVDVKMRNGRISQGFCAQVHHWDHRASASDIIAYRISGESK